MKRKTKKQKKQTNKQYKLAIIKNHKLTNNFLFDGIPFKGYVAS